MFPRMRSSPRKCGRMSWKSQWAVDGWLWSVGRSTVYYPVCECYRAEIVSGLAMVEYFRSQTRVSHETSKFLGISFGGMQFQRLCGLHISCSWNWLQVHLFKIILITNEWALRPSAFRIKGNLLWKQSDINLFINSLPRENEVWAPVVLGMVGCSWRNSFNC